MNQAFCIHQKQKRQYLRKKNFARVNTGSLLTFNYQIECWPDLPERPSGVIRRSRGSVFGKKWTMDQRRLHTDFNFHPYVFSDFESIYHRTFRSYWKVTNHITGLVAVQNVTFHK